MEKVPRKIYCFWTGRNEMPPQRQECLNSMYMNIGVHIQMLYWKDWYNMILPDHPLHEGFRYLSCIHKADYLRCYFMHHFGGGYSDIKYYTSQNNWSLCFDIINKHPTIQCIGEPEVQNGSPISDYNEPDKIKLLLCNCYFICRRYSDFTSAWYDKLLSKMDNFYMALRTNPAQDPFGRNKGYPIPWAALQGEIFHETIIEFRNQNPDAISSSLFSGRDKTHKWGGIFG